MFFYIFNLKINLEFSDTPEQQLRLVCVKSVNCKIPKLQMPQMFTLGPGYAI